MKIQATHFDIANEQAVIDLIEKIIPDEESRFDGRITDYEIYCYPHEWIELVDTVIPENMEFWEKVEYCYSVKVIL